MYLKLTQAGYETFNGTFGSIDFLDGVSVFSVSAQQAAGVSLVICCEEITDAQEANPVPVDPQAPVEVEDPQAVDVPAEVQTDPAPETV
jgi:hypothetical protein